MSYFLIFIHKIIERILIKKVNRRILNKSVFAQPISLKTTHKKSPKIKRSSPLPSKIQNYGNPYEKPDFLRDINNTELRCIFTNFE